MRHAWATHDEGVQVAAAHCDNLCEEQQVNVALHLSEVGVTDLLHILRRGSRQLV